jgi:hypothetical protein
VIPVPRSPRSGCETPSARTLCTWERLPTPPGRRLRGAHSGGDPLRAELEDGKSVVPVTCLAIRTARSPIVISTPSPPAADGLISG